MQTAHLVLVMVLAVVAGQKSRDCGEGEVCVNIRRCTLMARLLQTYGRHPEVRQRLRDSSCGFEGTDPLVCCRTETATTGGQAKPRTTTDQSERQGRNKESIPSDDECGHSSAELSRVVNGVPARKGEFPWMAALGYKSKSNKPRWLCGGALVTKRHVLTAGHCVHNRPDLYLVRLGVVDLYNPEETPKDVGIAKSLVHPDYSSTAFTNDIALLTLVDSVDMTPVCLGKEDALPGKYAVVSGWGAVQFNGPSSDVLMKAILPVRKNDDCVAAFKRFKNAVLDDRIVCAGYLNGEQDACQGDSGGPLMLAKSGSKEKVQYAIVGVVSYGYRCAEQEFPGVYTRVTRFRDWIVESLDY